MLHGGLSQPTLCGYAISGKMLIAGNFVVLVLRAGVNRGLAGPCDLPGPAAGAGRGAGPRARTIEAEFFDAGQSRAVAWGRRPQAAALIAALADPDRGRDAVVIGEYERAFYGSQYALMAPLFEHYGVQFWMPEAGGRVDFASEHDEQAMLVLGLSSKRR